jgi:hypothetical protein
MRYLVVSGRIVAVLSVCLAVVVLAGCQGKEGVKGVKSEKGVKAPGAAAVTQPKTEEKAPAAKVEAKAEDKAPAAKEEAKPEKKTPETKEVGKTEEKAPAAKEEAKAEEKAPIPDVKPEVKPAEKTPSKTETKSDDADLNKLDLEDMPAAAEKPATQAAPASDEEPNSPKKPRDLGKPLVDDFGSLKKLDPVQPVWIDAKQKQVVFMAETCKADYPLEFFATLRDRGYESVVVMDVRPSVIHAGLLAVGAKPGAPFQFEPKYVPPTGAKVEIEVRWKDKDGTIQKAPAQKWIRNIKTKKPMSVDWVFAGSGIRNGFFLADSGDFISVLNLQSAVLDIPIKSEGAIESRSYEGAVDQIPPQGTPVTVILKPEVK